MNNSAIDDEIKLKDLLIKCKHAFYLIKSKFKLIIIIALLGGGIGLFYSLIEKTRYKAVLTFAMEEDKGGASGGLSGALGLASSFGIDLSSSSGGGAFAASNLTELMRSRLLVEKTLLKPIYINGNTTNLAQYYFEFSGLKNSININQENLKKINFYPIENRIKYTLQKDSLLGVIYNKLVQRENLSIQQKDKKISIISIEVNSQNELFSKLFCENLAIETSNFYIETKSKKSRLNVDVLQKQVDSVRNELNSAISGVANEVDNVYNLNPAFNKLGTPSKKRQIDVQANTAILTQIIIQLELAQINLRKETPLIQLIDKPILPLESDHVGKLKGFIFGFVLFSLITIFFISIQIILKKILS